MKKILILIVSSLLILTSCDDNESLTFDNVNGQTLIAFTKGNDIIQIPIGDGNSTDLEIKFDISTKSTSERTITFSIVSEETNAPDNIYSIPSFTAIIPADSYQATVIITGYYDTILDSSDKNITLKIDSVSNGYFKQDEVMKVTLQMYCPVPDDFFVGNYLIEQTSAYIDGPTLSDGTIVEVVTSDEGDTKRSFSTKNYPDYCSSNMTFSFNLVCNEIIVDTMDSVCSCGDDSNWFEAADIPTTYDISTSDDIMFVTFTDDAQNNCGTPAQTTYKFTKQ